MDNIVKLFGTRVRLLRKQKKYSQERLSELAGLHPTYIGQVERAEKKCTLDTANRIAKALDTSLSDLVAESDFAEQILMSVHDPEKQQIITELVFKLSELDTEKLKARADIISSIAAMD